MLTAVGKRSDVDAPMQSEKEPEVEFSRPVESIMRCEDFKSNFARKLSNRYISRSPVSKSDVPLTLLKQKADKAENASERIETCTQLSKSDVEQNNEPIKPPDKNTTNNSDMRNTEITALNIEVETLRWQLSQTEANRQMHIALLKQVVSFLSKVKEHIEYQKPEVLSKADSCGWLTPRPFNVADLPRSRSVFHVNKTLEYSVSPVKKHSNGKISNVNGYKDAALWNNSKLFVTSEIDAKQKITEEMSRLISLANTVLSTKLPDLSCNCNDATENICPDGKESDDKIVNKSPSLTTSDEEITNTFIINTICDSDDTSNVIKNGFNESIPRSVKKILKEYTTSNFIEDESGFSSMSSFQEIGIPIINIIPPSPCKEESYIEDIADNLDEDNKWKNEAINLDKQSFKVFWV